MRTDILLFTALSLATLNAFPADYYVDSSGGSDSASGTSPAEAWKTLARTRKGEIKPGDTVRLACGGIWREQLIPVSGELDRQDVKRLAQISADYRQSHPIIARSARNPLAYRHARSLFRHRWI